MLDEEIFPLLRELGIGVTAYGVLSRGLLAGSAPGKQDFRSHLPRFSGDNATRNAQLVEKLHAFAAELQLAPAQVMIAWVLAKGDSIVPLVGARTRVQLETSLGAVDVRLSPADIARVEAIVADLGVAGTRDAHQMQILDSER